jgi:DNA primase
VATLGTATTPIHARTLLRQTDKLYYCFDGDNAGRKAAWRALENTLEALADGKEVFFLFLPEGEDPDTWVRSNGKPAFEQFMQQEAVPLSTFLIRELSREANLSSQEGRAKLLKNATPLLQKIAAPLLASLIRRQLGDTLGMSANDVGALTGVKQQFSPRTGRAPAGARARPSICRPLARALIAKPDFAAKIDPGKLPADDPHSDLLAKLADWLSTFESPPTPAAMLEDPNAQPFQAELGELQGEIEMLEQSGNWNPEEELSGGLDQINSNWERRRREELSKRPVETLSPAERAELLSPNKA